MGSIIGWRCEDCGSGEEFWCGAGGSYLDDADVEALLTEGAFGPRMTALLKGGIPEGWYVFRENEYFECPECGGIVAGQAFRIYADGESGWLVYHTEPQPCSTCGERLYFWADKVALSERKLTERCQGFASHGCPRCGGSHVSAYGGSWD